MHEPCEFTPDYDKYRGMTAEEAEHAREADRILAVDDDPRTEAARRAEMLIQVEIFSPRGAETQRKLEKPYNRSHPGGGNGQAATET